MTAKQALEKTVKAKLEQLNEQIEIEISKGNYRAATIDRVPSDVANLMEEELKRKGYHVEKYRYEKSEVFEVMAYWSKTLLEHGNPAEYDVDETLKRTIRQVGNRLHRKIQNAKKSGETSIREDFCHPEISLDSLEKDLKDNGYRVEWEEAGKDGYKITVSWA